MNVPFRQIPDIDDDDAEKVAIASAVAEARANRRGAPHDEVRAWLLRIAAGEFGAEPPETREL